MRSPERTLVTFVTQASNMALHTDVGLGDFILMDKINMEEFTKNLKIRCGSSHSRE